MKEELASLKRQLEEAEAELLAAAERTQVTVRTDTLHAHKATVQPT
jgi:hypothetical protein